MTICSQPNALSVRTGRLLLISDVTYGGAAVACRRLLHGLKNNGDWESLWIAAAGACDKDAGIASLWPSALALARYRLCYRMCKSETGRRRSEVVLNESNVIRVVRKWKPDTINVHNIHDATSFRLVTQLPRDVPVVWTLHDMWPLTGYCCYSYECCQYLNGCRGGCPEAGKWGIDFPPPSREWDMREQFFLDNRDRITLVSPSRWLAERAKQRFNNKLRVECIPYGLPLDQFRPVDSKAKVRAVLGLPVDRHIILAGAQSVADKRKGTGLLVEATDMLRKRLGGALAIVLFGEMAGIPLPEGFICTGTIRDEQLLNLYYNAADVFVLPSLADNLPNVLLEATAAGTPCVAFDTGGCSEIVRDGQTGFVAKYKDAEDLARCIERVLVMQDDQTQHMRKLCRNVAESEYGLHLQSERYAKLFSGVTRGLIN